MYELITDDRQFYLHLWSSLILEALNKLGYVQYHTRGIVCE